MKISKDDVFSRMESLLFISPEPRPISDFALLFEEEIPLKKLTALMEELQDSYKEKNRGLSLEKISKGWQLRTKPENKGSLSRIRPKSSFRLSRPSLEVLSIVAFEQPCTKMQIDEIRGVESGHLLRTLLDKELLQFAGKSDLPGKASLYKTSSRFLEVFGMEDLKDLPSKEEIEELISSESGKDRNSWEGLKEELPPSKLSIPYRQDEQENQKIKDTLKSLPSTVAFLKEKEDLEKKETLEQKEEFNSSSPDKDLE